MATEFTSSTPPTNSGRKVCMLTIRKTERLCRLTKRSQRNLFCISGQPGGMHHADNPDNCVSYRPFEKEDAKKVRLRRFNASGRGKDDQMWSMEHCPFYIKAPRADETDVYMAVKNSDVGVTNRPVVLVEESHIGSGDDQFTKVEVAQVDVDEANNYVGLKLVNFSAKKDMTFWLVMGNGNKLVTSIRKTDSGTPDRGWFKTGRHDGSGKFLEAMWVTKSGGRATVDAGHDFFLINDGTHGSLIKSIAHTESESGESNEKTQWYLVPKGVDTL